MFAVMPQSPPVVLTIAGFDPSSGAGITADIKTIAAHGCYGVAAITASTVQSTSGVWRVEGTESRLLRESLDALADDMKISAVHIGMLATTGLVAVVADFLTANHLPSVVLDTILVSSSGATLLEDSGVQALMERLVPLATVVTPNVQEAAVLTKTEVETLDQMREAAAQLQELGAKGVLVTGGHLEAPTDVLRLPNGDFQTFKAERLATNFTHGTGCALSTAIASNLAQGRPLSEAVLLAKAFVTSAIANGYPIGKGVNPVNHMYRMKNHPSGFTKRFASGKD